MKFKIGDRVRITDNLHGHEFRIGQTVTIKQVSEIDYMAEDIQGNYWFVDDDEVIRVNEDLEEHF